MKEESFRRPAAATGIRSLLLVAVFIAGIAAERIGLVEYLSDPWEREYVLFLAGQHLYLVAVSMAMALVTGLATGIIVSRKRFRKFAGVVMYVIGLGQTIPSLAVLALTMSFLGIGSKPAILALYIYSTLPIARNTLAGILSVSPAIIDAARGVGMSPVRILLEVEIPNALNVILTGIRIALVINIGTAALGYLIGAGGLGDLVFTGINLMRTELLLAGALPITILALAGDYLLELLSLLIVPKGIRMAG
ncbi:MAG TPA: ABC transporter permease [Syntrophales bacterium]|nr:ABC transporter permease [Syntrophales bacterium]HQA83627.1 ABC transporter permease [Syntrophales bacterium]HQN78293.1 ABC transporter permease [Syntrophales bacterium]HQQ27145.1 ABC transporter permease [Syntrophales bacterium]